MSVFRSPEGRDRVRALYNGILSGFPVEKKYVDTPAGRTFVLDAGAKENPPVVLLHGSCGNSAFWLGDIFPLAERFRVISVDIIGEAGNSDENRLDFDSGAYVRWLEAVLDALAIPRMALVGNSYGGWLALKFAIARPERVAKLAAFVAAGIAPPSSMFQAESLKEHVNGTDGRAALNDAITDGVKLPEPVMVFLRLIGENFLPMTEALPVFSDEALSALPMPSLFVFAERDATMDAATASSRVRALLPEAETRVLAGQGHVVMNIADLALPFLTQPLKLRTVDTGEERAALVDRWARVTNAGDLLDAMVTAGYLGCSGMILYEESLGSAFFDLKTGVAGEMLQKFSNYTMRLAIIGNFEKFQSRSLRDFIRESNSGKIVCFVDSQEQALTRLSAR